MLKKAVTKSSAKKKLADIKKGEGTVSRGRKKRQAARRKQARGSLKKRKTAEVLNKIALTNSYVLKGKVHKIEKDRMGRPTVVTTEVVSKLEYAFVYDSTVEQACLYAGISTKTYYRFVEKEPDFRDRIAELREASILVLRQTVLSEAVEDADKALKYLERKRKREFSLRTEIAHSGEVVNRHAIDPKTATLIKQVMGNFARKTKSLAKKKMTENATTSTT